MRLDARIISIVLAMLSAGLLAAVQIISPVSVRREVDRCFANNCFDLEAGTKFSPLITSFIQGSGFGEKLNVSAPPRDGFLNVYFAASDLPGRLSTINCNCAYVGSAIVICDSRFVSAFGSAVQFTRGSFYGENADSIWEEEKEIVSKVNDQISRVLFSWILGHEIGHSILHDNKSIGRRRFMTQEQELEADKFYIVKALRGADERRKQELYFGITQFIFSIVPVAFQARDGGGVVVIAPSIDDVHPPWLIRALKLGQHITDLDPNAKGNAFYKDLSRLVEVRPGGTEIGSFCEYKNLREIGAQLQQKRQQLPIEQISPAK